MASPSTTAVSSTAVANHASVQARNAASSRPWNGGGSTVVQEAERSGSSSAVPAARTRALDGFLITCLHQEEDRPSLAQAAERAGGIPPDGSPPAGSAPIARSERSTLRTSVRRRAHPEQDQLPQVGSGYGRRFLRLDVRGPPVPTSKTSTIIDEPAFIADFSFFDHEPDHISLGDGDHVCADRPLVTLSYRAGGCVKTDHKCGQSGSDRPYTLATERDWAKKLGVRTPEDAMLTDEGLNAHRNAYCDAIRALHAEGKMARTWPLRFLIRHTAFHTMDHAWEMEDKDLTPTRA